MPNMSAIFGHGRDSRTRLANLAEMEAEATSVKRGATAVNRSAPVKDDQNIRRFGST
jgi:hypothetical protein